VIAVLEEFRSWRELPPFISSTILRTSRPKLSVSNWLLTGCRPDKQSAHATLKISGYSQLFAPMLPKGKAIAKILVCFFSNRHWLHKKLLSKVDEWQRYLDSQKTEKHRREFKH
jgi:hypothetical protein